MAPVTTGLAREGIAPARVGSCVEQTGSGALFGVSYGTRHSSKADRRGRFLQKASRVIRSTEAGAGGRSVRLFFFTTAGLKYGPVWLDPPRSHVPRRQDRCSFFFVSSRAFGAFYRSYFTFLRGMMTGTGMKYIPDVRPGVSFCCRTADLSAPTTLHLLCYGAQLRGVPDTSFLSM